METDKMPNLKYKNVFHQRVMSGWKHPYFPTYTFVLFINLYLCIVH